MGSIKDIVCISDIIHIDEFVKTIDTNVIVCYNKKSLNVLGYTGIQNWSALIEKYQDVEGIEFKTVYIDTEKPEVLMENFELNQ